MFNRIWLTPPLAFARVGASATPSAAFMWAGNDLSPDGSGQTTLQIADTISLDANGVPSLTRPDTIIFRDAQGIRPVCPYFELHGSWTEKGREVSGPVTIAVLKANDVKLQDLSWTIHCAQLKAFHYTYNDDDRIDAVMHIGGDDTKRHVIEGRSPARAKQPLVPKGAFVPLGMVQAAQPNAVCPEIRLRFYAPPGVTYGPTNIAERLAKADFKIDANREWRKLKIPPQRRILNSKSDWAKYVLERARLGPLGANDLRNTPEGLFAFLLVGPDANNAQSHSLGLVDDISDGLITCTLKAGKKTLTAAARVVVGPPDFGPVSRPPVSLADNLADRMDRAAPRDEASWTMDELGDIVLDIFERAFETSDLINKDYQNWRCHADNLNTLGDLGGTSALDLDDVNKLLWADIAENIEAVSAGKAAPLHLSEGGRRKHRRYAAIEYLETRFRENPDLFDKWIRRPFDPNPYFDTRMPALMRGSDTRPWHLTRRQWEIVRMWIARLRQPPPSGGAATGATAKPGA